MRMTEMGNESGKAEKQWKVKCCYLGYCGTMKRLSRSAGQQVTLLVHLPCHLGCLLTGYTKKTCFRTVHLREEGKVFCYFSSPAGGQLSWTSRLCQPAPSTALGKRDSMRCGIGEAKDFKWYLAGVWQWNHSGLTRIGWLRGSKLLRAPD